MLERNENNGRRLVLQSLKAIAAAKETTTDIFPKGSIGVVVAIANCHFDVAEAWNVIDLLRKNQSCVKELEFIRCTGHLDMILTAALTTCTKLESLSIALETVPSATTFDPLARALGVGLLLTSKNITKLEIENGSYWNCFTLTADAAFSLAQGLSGNKSLATLHVNHCRFADRKALRIFCEKGLASLSTTLRHAKFNALYQSNGQPIGDHDVATLVRALEHCSQLESLDLGSNKCLDMGMIALASLLDRTPIKKLDVSFQAIDENEFMNTYHLVGALGRTRTLESLRLQSNKLSTDYDMANLAAALSHNNSVKFLDLSHNRIKSSAMTIFSSSLLSMKGLETLFMDHMVSTARSSTAGVSSTSSTNEEGNVNNDDDDNDNDDDNEGNYRLDDEASKNLANAMKDNFLVQRILLDQRLADYELIQYYADLNWVGRRFIEPQNHGGPTSTTTSSNSSSATSSHSSIPSIPLPLWPLLLSRTNRLEEIRKTKTTILERRANLIFYCLQKGSVIFPV